MKRAIVILGVLALCVGVGAAKSYRRRTLDEKVKEAQLIVFGTATAFGTNLPLVMGTYESYGQSIRVSVAAVLWPTTRVDKSDIVFHYDATPNWLRRYSNSPGVFFLTKNIYPDRGEWDQLHRFEDWMEPSTNLLGVVASIQKQKGPLRLDGLLQVPQAPFEQTLRYGSSAYESFFREGYFDALMGKNGLWMFGPTNAEDKVKVIGYADGQVAGNAAWSRWIRNH